MSGSGLKQAEWIEMRCEKKDGKREWEREKRESKMLTKERIGKCFH